MNLQDIYTISKALGDVRFIINWNKLLNISVEKAIQSIELLKYIFELAAYKIESLPFLLDILKKNSISLKTQKELEKVIDENKKLLKKSFLDKERSFKYIKNMYFELEKKIPLWEDRIYSEIGELVISKPYLEGNLSYKKLQNGIDGFFDSNVWDNMQEIERKDLEDFRICYLHKAWTPAGIMAMRVIESAIRKYYLDLTGEEKNNWWRITEELMNHTDSNKVLIKKLDYIREHIRNPLAHPELRLNAQEIEEIFLQAVQVLIMIYG